MEMMPRVRVRKDAHTSKQKQHHAVLLQELAGIVSFIYFISLIELACFYLAAFPSGVRPATEGFPGCACGKQTPLTAVFCRASTHPSAMVSGLRIDAL